MEAPNYLTEIIKSETLTPRLRFLFLWFRPEQEA